MAASTVCNLQRILSSGAVLNLLHAVHVANPWDLAKVLLEARKMAQIDSLDDEVHVDRAVGGGTCLNATDVGAVFGDDGCELLEQAGAVVDCEGQLDRVGRRLGPSGVLGIAECLGPLDLDAAIGLVKKILDVGTASRVYGDALASRDVTNDLFAANGVATSRTVDEEIVLSFHLKRLRAFAEEDALHGFAHVRERVDDCTLLRRGFFGFDGTSGFELVQDLTGGVLSKADPGEEILLAVETVLVGDAIEVRRAELLQRDFVFACFAFEEFATDLDGTFALMLVEPVLDLVAGP